MGTLTQVVNGLEGGQCREWTRIEGVTGRDSVLYAASVCFHNFTARTDPLHDGRVTRSSWLILGLPREWPSAGEWRGALREQMCGSIE